MILFNEYGKMIDPETERVENQIRLLVRSHFHMLLTCDNVSLVEIKALSEYFQGVIAGETAYQVLKTAIRMKKTCPKNQT